MSRTAWIIGAALFAASAITMIVAFQTGMLGRGDAAPVVPELEDFGRVPAFTLVDQTGQPFSSEQLKGRVWMANTFFTYCKTICPPLMDRLHGFQKELDAEGDTEVMVVSISIDPENDTPERLQWYERNQTQGDPKRWKLLTGPEKDVLALVTGGFHSHVGERTTSAEGLEDIVHSGQIFLVDRDMTIRGYFASDADDQHKLRQTLKQLREAAK